MAQVRIEHVWKRFGVVTAVHDFDVTVKDGEFVSILGPSGCGKTTMLRMIAGFEKASEGDIYIGERLVSSSREKTFVPPEKRDIGMVFQSYAVWPHMTVAENVAYPLKIKKCLKQNGASVCKRCWKWCTWSPMLSAIPISFPAGSSSVWR